MRTNELPVITAAYIAKDVGCSVQTVRKRMKEAPTHISQLQIGKSAVYMRSDLGAIRSLICDKSLARGGSDTTKEQMRDRHDEAYRMRHDSKMTYKQIATTLGYATESGAWRAIILEKQRREKQKPTYFDKAA
jgi:AraC-like DNA-binding protein